MKFNNFFNLYPNKTKPVLRKIAMGFSLCYIMIFFKYECSQINQSVYSKKLQCSWDSFWRKSQEREIELNNLPKRISALQYNANDPIEDRYSAVELKNFKGYFISVLDGHGGFQMSQYANERLYKYFDEIYQNLKLDAKISDEDELVKTAIYSSFEKVEKEFYNLAIDLYRSGEGKLATVGSCVLVSIISPKKVYTAQLGDSKAKLFQKSEEGFKIVRITNTHNAEKKREQEILFKEFTDRDIIVCKRPNNTVCYVKGRLQPTRSLGDFHLKYKEFNQFFEGKYKKPISNFKGPYIKSVPEINIHEITLEDQYIVMGSDGLWDFLNANEVAEIISNKKNLKSIADGLFTEVMTRAANDAQLTFEKLMKIPAGKRRKLHDDITILVFDLRH